MSRNTANTNDLAPNPLLCTYLFPSPSDPLPIQHLHFAQDLLLTQITRTASYYTLEITVRQIERATVRWKKEGCRALTEHEAEIVRGFDGLRLAIKNCYRYDVLRELADSIKDVVRRGMI
jgi:hypothetical protein